MFLYINEIINQIKCGEYIYWDHFESTQECSKEHIRPLKLAEMKSVTGRWVSERQVGRYYWSDYIS